MKSIFSILLFLIPFMANSQSAYQDSMKAYIQDYVVKHEVVSAADKQFFHFYPVNENYRVVARFTPASDGKWFNMETSGAIKKTFRVYGVLKFTIHDTTATLNLYQSQNLMGSEDYKDYLFLPFTDLSSGETTYAAGRYLDLNIRDIKNGTVVLDFNKAYNPYCAYVSDKYNCPVPPRENHLSVHIAAGEQTFAKP